MCKPAQRQATLFCSVHRNTFPMVWSQADHLVFGMKWNIQCAAARTAIGRGPLLHPGCGTGNILGLASVLGWPLSMFAGCRGFKVDLQVPSKKRQPVMDVARGAAIRSMAPTEKIKWDQRNRKHFRSATSLQGRNIKCIFSASLAWNFPWLLLHAVLEIRIQSDAQHCANKKTLLQQLDIVVHTSTGVLWCWWDFLMKH